MGDINIAHTERDIKNWKGNLKTAGFLPEERAYLDRFFGELGWVDVHRAARGRCRRPLHVVVDAGQAFDTDTGWRLDYQFATRALADAASSAVVGRAASWDARWSDHAPLTVDYDLSPH